MPGYRTVQTEVSAQVGVLTLNRPEALNAFDDVMVKEIEAALNDLLGDDGVRVVVVTGAGRAFCAGADVKFLHRCLTDGKVDDAAVLVEAGGRIARAIRCTPKPVIAAVNGAAVGGGANLALVCDMRFAAESAGIAQAFNRIGLVPDWGGTYFVPRIVGTAKALELFWSGDFISASEALRLGLFNRVVPDAALLETAREFAAELARKPQAAIGGAKEATLASAGRTLAAMLEWEEETQRKLFASDAAREALAKFVSQRS